MSETGFWCCPRLDEDSKKTRILRLLEFLKKYSKYYVYQENGKDSGKLHYHVAIWCKDEKEFKAIKQRWSDHFKDINGTERSCAKDKTGRYHVYVTKDKNRIKTEGITEEELDNIQESSYQVQETQGRSTFTEWLCEQFDKDHEGIIPEENYRSAQRYMCDWIIEKWKLDDKQTMRPFKMSMIADIINTIMIKYSDKFLFDLNEPYKFKIRDQLINFLH